MDILQVRFGGGLIQLLDFGLNGRAEARPTFLILTTILFCFLLAGNLPAQTNPPQRYWLYFKDKGSKSPSRDPQSLGISERALKRRAKVLTPDRLIDERDQPVAQEYLEQLRMRGLQVRAVSRWLNAVSVGSSPNDLSELLLLPFVKSAEVVATAKRPELSVSALPVFKSLEKGARINLLEYGPSLTQLKGMKVPDVHNLGINGSGVLVGMIDDGFNNHKVHSGIKHITVLAEYDYIQGDSNTTRETTESRDQGDHGAATMSVLAGFEIGKLIGSAYGVSMILAKSEYDPTETQIELDNYVTALEWMESLGVDVVSTSLGYDDLDPYRRYNSGDIVYSMKDGKTAVTSKAAQIAASKGVLLVTAMGNEFWWQFDNTWKAIPGEMGSLVTPADADSVVAVGATFSDGLLADFSSTGPTSDGRIKPEVVTQGTAIIAADGKTTSGYYGITRASTQGTSFSTPLTAGVAALVFSAHPELGPMQVREALLNTATRINDTDPVKNISSWPNNWYGYGFVNALEAVLYHGLVVSNRPLVVASDSFFTITTWIKSKNVLTADSLAVYFKKATDVAFQRAALIPSGEPDRYFVRIPRSAIDSASVGYISARDNGGISRRNPSNAPDSLLSLGPTPDSILQVYPPPVGTGIPEDFVLHPNYPNPFNGSTSVLFEAPRAEDVELAVFNILGQRIRTLFQGRAVQGVNRFSWDGRDELGKTSSSGVYFYRLKTLNLVTSGKMLLIK